MLKFLKIKERKAKRLAREAREKAAHDARLLAIMENTKATLRSAEAADRVTQAVLRLQSDWDILGKGRDE